MIYLKCPLGLRKKCSIANDTVLRRSRKKKCVATTKTHFLTKIPIASICDVNSFHTAEVNVEVSSQSIQPACEAHTHQQIAI